MPSLDHESLVLLFRNQPELAAQLLREALHLELPAYTEARLASSDLTEVVPTEFRADAVVLLVDGNPVLGVIVEAQLSRDERKRFTWPAYVAVLRARHECPVELLVLTPDSTVAAWASVPINLDLAGGSVVRPRVLGPDAIPIVTDPAQAAREPELAVLSAMTHGNATPKPRLPSLKQHPLPSGVCPTTTKCYIWRSSPPLSATPRKRLSKCIPKQKKSSRSSSASASIAVALLAGQPMCSMCSMRAGSLFLRRSVSASSLVPIWIC
jgi:hypothetical protein